MTPAGGVDLLDLVADQEPRHVEIVDGHVEEHAAGDFDVGERGRRGIAADDVQQPRRADLAALPPPRGRGRNSESKRRLKPIWSLTPALPDGFKARSRFWPGCGRWAFRRRCACRPGRPDDQVGVRVGRGADQHRLDRGVGQDLLDGAGDSGDAAAGGHRCGGLAVQIGDRHGIGLRDTEGQGLGVHLADASRADDSDIQSLSSDQSIEARSPRFGKDNARWKRRYSRLRRALSFGEPMPGRTSCSTSM